LEINDYPPVARRKVTHRETLESVTEMTGVAIKQRGEFAESGKRPEIGKRKLYVNPISIRVRARIVNISAIPQASAY
jgi:hypothetical protein